MTRAMCPLNLSAFPALLPILQSGQSGYFLRHPALRKVLFRRLRVRVDDHRGIIEILDTM
jgi:hypothetical protein